MKNAIAIIHLNRKRGLQNMAFKLFFTIDIGSTGTTKWVKKFGPKC